MTLTSPFDDIVHAVQVSTDVHQLCQVCRAEVPSAENIANWINHYIDAHGYRLLHVGQQSTMDFEGKPYQTTVAVLGKPRSRD